MFSEIFINPLLPRALVLGAFAGIALILTISFSRQGPLVFIPYAALALAMAFLMVRHDTFSFGARTIASFSAFVVATLFAYCAAAILGARARERLRRKGRLGDDRSRLSPWGRAWRMGALGLAGLVAAVGIVFVAA